jgi:hypothetical protein
MCHADRSGYTSAETDAVIGPRNIIVHGLGHGNHFVAFLRKPDPVAERIVATYENQIIYAQVFQIFQGSRGERTLTWLLEL